MRLLEWETKSKEGVWGRETDEAVRSGYARLGWAHDVDEKWISNAAMAALCAHWAQVAQSSAAPTAGCGCCCPCAHWPRLGRRRQHGITPRLGRRRQHGITPRLGRRRQHGITPRLGRRRQHGITPRLGRRRQHGITPRLGPLDRYCSSAHPSNVERGSRPSSMRPRISATLSNSTMAWWQVVFTGAVALLDRRDRLTDLVSVGLVRWLWRAHQKLPPRVGARVWLRR